MVPERLYGIAGYPLGHSLSPLLHNWGFERLGLAASYHAWRIPPGGAQDFVRAVRLLPVSGASVTIPHKEAVLPFLDRITDRARAVGAVNTLFWEGGTLCGDNTDVLGFTAPLTRMGVRPGTALVLGAGGACRAVLAGLRELGAGRVLLANRTRDRAEATARDFPGVEVADWEDRQRLPADLVVNATPLGMAGDLAGHCPLDPAALVPSATVYDLIYNPLRTVLVRAAEAAGCRAVTGLEMFLAQGAEQFRLWTGRDLDLPAARSLLLEALGERVSAGS